MCVYVRACVCAPCAKCVILFSHFESGIWPHLGSVCVCVCACRAQVGDKVRARCHIFKHSFQLIHVFILSDPVLLSMETMTYLPHKELKGEREKKRREVGRRVGGARRNDGDEGGVVVEREGMRDDGKVEGVVMERERRMWRRDPEVGEERKMEWHIK